MKILASFWNTQEKVQISQEYPLIHQIAFSDNPESYVPNRNSVIIKKQFGEDNYRLWNLQETELFLGSSYPSDVLSTFKKLKPYSYKADLARYCIVNFFGGIYADLSVNSLRAFSVENYDMVLFRDGNSSRTSWKVGTHFFFSKPNNAVLQDSIQQCVKNALNKYYGWDPHFPTGPSVLGKSVSNFGSDLNILVGQYYWLRYRKNKYVLPNNQIIARHKRGGAYLGGQSGVAGGNNYNEMWLNRDIYSNE